jgi:imidazolonepropionase-like amidohydrolase
VPVLFRNARVFDGDSEVLREGFDVLVADGVISRLAPSPLAVREPVEVVDCAGRILMPGLIDAHVHVYAAGLNFTRVAQSPFSYLAHFAARFMRASLDRGFTTLRDVGGADVGLASALKEGLLDRVPRLFYGGRAISQTGGHGDFRPGDYGCACHIDTLTVIADGVDAVRRAVREELRRGASHIKLMASGGIASPTDPLEYCQYSDDEIRAAVDEGTRAGSYVATHCHPAEAVRRSVALGVRSIEHATLIDRETATLVALVEEGEQLGLPAVSMDKLRRIGDRALGGLEIMKRAGVKMGLGTDLLGAQHVCQTTEFTLRAQVLPAIDILRSACAVNAELLGQSGRLGTIQEGAAADLLLVDGNPLADISVLDRNGDGLLVIMQDGRFHKRAL